MILKIVKKPFTLIELIVSLGLMMALLSSLGFFYQALAEMDSKSKEMENQGLQKLYLENRLFQIIPSIASYHDLKFNPAKSEFSDYFFFTSSVNAFPSVVFVLDSDVGINPYLNGHVLARLYVDELKQFCLGIWPLPSRSAKIEQQMFRKEVLLTDLKALKFSFLVPKITDFKLAWNTIDNFRKGRKVPPFQAATPSWLTEWGQGFERLPAMMRIEIEYGALQKIQFILPILRSETTPGGII